MVERALRTGRTVMAPDVLATRAEHAGRSGLYPMGARSLLVAPLRIRGTVLGVLVALMTDHSDRRFDPEDADLVQDAAARAAQAIDNARLFRAEQDARAVAERAVAARSRRGALPGGVRPRPDRHARSSRRTTPA